MDRTTIALQETLAGYMSSLNTGPAATACTALLDRFSALPFGWEMLDDFNVDTFCREIVGQVGPHAGTRDRKGRVMIEGINFASQDYLSLASHPKVSQAAVDAVARFGVHSSGSPALMGNTALSLALEQRLADYLGTSACTLFSTGWGAGFGTVRTLVRRSDHIVLDDLAHSCLLEGARASGGHLHFFEHLSVRALEERLIEIRKQDPSGGILVVTESLFSMDADTPDLQAHQDVARRYQATLLVDVAHDMGNVGTQGQGALETQGVVGRIDVVTGSFSKTFASNGGFVACNEPGLKMALRFACGTHTFTSAISPVQSAVVLAALDLVQSSEGLQRRQRLLDNTLYLRDRLEALGHKVLGAPCAIVPLLVGGIGRSRLLARYMLEGRMLVNLVEHPAVPRDASRLRLQLMAQHTREDLDAFTQTLQQAIAQADDELARVNASRPGMPALS